MKVSTRQAKVDWLLAHQDLWEGFPRGEQHTDPRQKSIVDEMKKARLISKSTYYPDVNLYNLIVEAREQRRGRTGR